jgi:hypothetical protein
MNSGLRLSVLGQHIWILTADSTVRNCLVGNFGAMQVPGERQGADLVYRITAAGDAFNLRRDRKLTARAATLGDLIYALEKEVTVEVQRRRTDLLFLHAAALEWGGRAFLLAADAGRGKSTTTWGLLHHGVRYLSDEMSPVDPHTLDVYAYPHALCLKNAPPAPYFLPGAAMHLGRTIHVPVSALPGPLAGQPQPLGALFLVRHDRHLTEPHLRALSKAEACAHLYVTALNALSHADRGLTPIARMASQVPCFEIRTAGLAASCRRILSVLERPEACSSSIC